jgi:hypothetical protein
MITQLACQVIGRDGAPIRAAPSIGRLQELQELFKSWPSWAQVDIISIINPLLIGSREVSLIISSRVETRTDARIDSVILVERIGVACSS